MDRPSLCEIPETPVTARNPTLAMAQDRRLLVTADDFGIGPMTSRGILDLAERGRVTCAVLLVTSPYAESSVDEWRDSGRPMELGWHPCLTLDRPVSNPGRVSSLVDRHGRFPTLGGLASRLATGRVRFDDVRREFDAQLARFVALVGEPPLVVNAHHHVHTFPIVGRALASVLSESGARPFVRRVREPWTTLWSVPGGRVKRAFLTMMGTAATKRLDRLGFAGNDYLAGVADHASVSDARFFARWLSSISGRDVDLMCHPGLEDPTLEGRDGTVEDGGLARRVREYELLGRDEFLTACANAGFRLTRPSRLVLKPAAGGRYAA